MAESIRPSGDNRIAAIEPDERLVVLARTLQAQDPEATWKDGVAPWTRFGEACLGQVLYRHQSVFRGGSRAPEWSHLELSYFHALVPIDALRDLAGDLRPAKARLLRAELLLTTPGAYLMPRGWRGPAHRREWQASLEYIDVRPSSLSEYRDIMRRYIGPAARKLVASGRIGTFRAMETAAVLYQDRSFEIDWNQIHLCELDAGNFEGFGPEFDAALHEISPDGGFVGVFAGLDRMRTIPRWTFNVPVSGADIAPGTTGFEKPFLEEGRIGS